MYIAPSIAVKHPKSLRVPLLSHPPVRSLTPLIITALLGVSCAGQRPPSGGPVDTTPPTVVATYPPPGTTHFHGAYVMLEFSKYVERRSLEESIFISPHTGALEFEWSGREVEIHFTQPLKENVTYVVTVGTDVVDLRNRNRMAEAFSFAFSTGNSIDSGIIRGRVFDPKPNGVTVFAYALNNRMPDTLNPARVQPEYVTQTGNDGLFTLPYLAWGRYRLFAVRDQYKNVVYEPQIDQIGMASGDVEVIVDRPVLDGVMIQLTVEDTTAPFVLSAEAVHKNLVSVKFSEAVDISTLTPASFTIHDTLSPTNVALDRHFYDPRSLTVVHVATADLDSTVIYRATVDGVCDTAGNAVNPAAHSALFRGTSLSDTLAPRVVAGVMRDSVRDVLYDVVFDFVFSEGVKKEPFEQGFRLVDSAGRRIEGTFRWRSSAAIRFTPNNLLLPLAWYSLFLQLDSVQDFSGNRLRDTIVTRRFQTIDWRKFGSIRGRIEDVVSFREGEMYVFAQSVTDKTQTPVVNRIGTAGEFSFEYLLEGQYVLSAFHDSDGDGRYSHGRSFPFVPSERFAVYPDTIKVRPRWPVEGVVIRFGEW